MALLEALSPEVFASNGADGNSLRLVASQAEEYTVPTGALGSGMHDIRRELDAMLPPAARIKAVNPSKSIDANGARMATTLPLLTRPPP